MAFWINIFLPIALVSSFVFASPSSGLLILFLLILNLINFYLRHIQKKHTLLRNFGIFAVTRYILESIGPEFRQYLYASDTEEKPFNRTERGDVYKKSKNIEKTAAFGSLLSFDHTEFKLRHSFYPPIKKGGSSFSLTFGEERGLSRAHTITQPLMIAGMSFGSLGQSAVRALARGARKANLTMNTGEGGFPKYHLMEKAPLIFQMGTAKFGVRKMNGELDPDKLKQISDLEHVKMIEIKFSQGGKPGKGGFLPKEKITEEIAKLRGIPLGQDAISPSRHKECYDASSTCKFIKHIQEISELPVGIKFCLGRGEELQALFSEMKKENIYPDFISIDGSEGGTGAAPKTFMDDLGMPLMEGLQRLCALLDEAGLRSKTKIIASGKLISAGKQMMILSLGADATYTARGFLLALGCIQALRCNTNSCPTGITTHSPHLTKGLDIEEKSERVKYYAINLMKDNFELLEALGVQSFSDLDRNHIFIPKRRRI